MKAITREDEIHSALVKLNTRKHLTVTKLGEKGAITSEGGHFISAPALPVQFVDTTGAGDNFDAGFIFGTLNGWETSRCLRFACICGSLTTRSAVGTHAQASLDEALSYLD